VATDQTILERRETVFDALGDGTRRAIIDLLAQRPRAVVDLAAELPVTRPAVSLHLRVLRDAGLVRDRSVGTRRIYRLAPEGLDVLRTYLNRMWASALDGFALAAEQAELDATGGVGAAGPTTDDPRPGASGAHPGPKE
jgi:DNA-binding transcriptional ArsR family regulator